MLTIMRITFLSLFIVIGAGLMLWSRPSTAAEARAEVRLGYFANVTHGQAVLAVATGELEKAIAPAKLTTRVFNAGPSVIEALFAGEIDIAYIGPGPVISDSPRQIGEQGRLGAILVNDAAVLRDFTCVLVVHIQHDVWDVRVPTLGAWAIGKALTFDARQVDKDVDPNADRRAKDLLYLRDLIYAGPDVLNQVKRDLMAVTGSKTGRHDAERAITRLAVASGIAIENAASRLAERERKVLAVARAEIGGVIRELGELIRQALST